MIHIIPCDKCGKPHTAYDGNPGCAGHKSGNPNQPCSRKPIKGGTVCRNHGGGSPKVKAAAEKRQKEELAEKEIKRILDDPNAKPVTDPVGELLLLAGRVRNAVDTIGERVNELTEIRYEADTEQLRGEVQVWERLLANLHRILVDIAKLGIEDRMASVAERDSQTVQLLLTSVLTRLGHDWHDPVVVQAVDAALAELPAGGDGRETGR